MPTKPQQDTKLLQVPAARRRKKTKRQRENTKENEDQESRGKKRHTDANIEQNNTTTNEADKGKEQANEQREKQKGEPNKKGNDPHKKITVTIQTREGQYETTLMEEMDEKCPLKQIREKLGLTRYRIPQPPEMMHNIPKYYTTKGLVNGKVLKFDIRRPTKDEQLWNKQTERTKNQTQECIIESHSEIRNNGRTKMNKRIDNQQENNQKNHTTERRREETGPTNERAEETHNNRQVKRKNDPINQQESGIKRQKLDPKGA